MDVNVKGVFFLTQKLLPLIRMAASADDPARIINIGSIDGLKSSHFDVFSYGASKAAVHHLTRFLAAHLAGEHINCNAIAPGPYPTKMLGSGFGGRMDDEVWEKFAKANPSGRVGTPEDIAASERSWTGKHLAETFRRQDERRAARNKRLRAADTAKAKPAAKARPKKAAAKPKAATPAKPKARTAAKPKAKAGTAKAKGPATRKSRTPSPAK